MTTYRLRVANALPHFDFLSTASAPIPTSTHEGPLSLTKGTEP
jgi:hypothetical protein